VDAVMTSFTATWRA